MKKNMIIKKALPIWITILVILAACTPAQPTASPDEIMTSVAMTVESDFTKTAIAMPTLTPTSVPTATATPPVMPSAPTAVLATTQPASQTTPTTAPATGTDAGDWVSSDPVDGSRVAAGQPFKVTLRLINKGTSTWTTSYAIQFASGAKMGAEDTINMPYDVPPDMIVEMVVEFTAPTATGTTRGDWNIVNAQGVAFSNFYFEYIVE